ncbi:MAG: PepSY domain-containing protein [Lachnospiraceae bacterium]
MKSIKNLFNTPKKAVLTSVCALGLIAVLGTGTVVAAIKASDSSNIQKQKEDKDRSEAELIGMESAKEIALEDAGVKAEAVSFTKEETENEDGIVIYELEFYSDDYEYEYEINATTGSIRERDKEALETDGKTGGNGQGEPTYIGTEKAKSIGLQHAGLSSDEVSFTKVKREEDDGQVVYEIEFNKDRKEYEYTIHAVSGDIVDFESDWDD